MADEARALWDPLWEYVFDDYDVEDEKGQKLRGQKEPEKEDKATFGFFSKETRDEEYEASPLSRKASHRGRKKAYQDVREPDHSIWGQGGAEQPEERQNDKTSRRKWRRSKPSARDGYAGCDDTDQPVESAWAVESTWGLTGELGICKKESSDKAITKDVTIEKNKKSPLKKLFKRPFRKEEQHANTNKDLQIRNDSTSTRAVVLTIEESKQESALVRSKTEQSKNDESEATFLSTLFGSNDSTSARAVALTIDEPKQESRPVRSKTESSRIESRTDRSKTEQSKNDESEATFVSALFGFAGLDPWMTESDSDSDSDTRTENTDESTEQPDDRIKDGMAAGRDAEEFSQPTGDFTEIRLQHTPARQAPPDEESTAQQGIESRKPKQMSFHDFELSGLDPITLERTRRTIGGEFGADWQLYDPVEITSRDHYPDSTFRERRDPFPSDEYFRKSNKILQSVAELDAGGVYETPKGLKRLVCCGAKKYTEQGTEESGENRKREEMSDMLPRSRMISDQQTSIVGKKFDAEDVVLGVPSDRFLKAKGPQSLYAYDYTSNQHMDVAYSHFSQQHRAGIDCRAHAELPPMESPSGDRAIVQVEASTISETDCIIRQGNWWRHESVPLPNIPGVDMVGKIYDIKDRDSTRYDLYPCQTVLSLVKWGGNARYAPVPPSHLVKVPDAVDPAQAACLPQTYLTAFQILHFGQLGAIRYRENSLRGKSVLIVGGMADNMGRAIIDLALNAGAANIYATAKKKHWSTLIDLGIMPLSQAPHEWILRLEGMIDLVLASNGGLREDVTATHCRALCENGHLILSGNRLVGKDIVVGDWKLQQSQLICNKNKSLSRLMSRTHSYDVFEQWEKNLDTCKKDLTHLLKLLERGVIKPKILDRIPLNKVGKAHEALFSKRLRGFLVCEPWLKTKKRAVYL